MFHEGGIGKKESKKACKEESKKSVNSLYSCVTPPLWDEWMSLNCTWLTPTYCIPPNVHCC